MSSDLFVFFTFFSLDVKGKSCAPLWAQVEGKHSGEKPPKASHNWLSTLYRTLNCIHPYLRTIMSDKAQLVLQITLMGLGSVILIPVQLLLPMFPTQPTSAHPILYLHSLKIGPSHVPTSTAVITQSFQLFRRKVVQILLAGGGAVLCESLNQSPGRERRNNHPILSEYLVRIHITQGWVCYIHLKPNIAINRVALFSCRKCYLTTIFISSARSYVPWLVPVL